MEYVFQGYILKLQISYITDSTTNEILARCYSQEEEDAYKAEYDFLGKPYTVTKTPQEEFQWLDGREFTSEEIRKDYHLTLASEGEDKNLSDSIRLERAAILDTIDRLYCNASNWELMSLEEKTAWQQYKQDLRDITEQSGFPHDVIWPTMPEKQ